jgi:deazaflavin-dependent oxidoreductase (nitroreductase family)
VAYQQVGDDLAVFASKGGADTNPDWFHNVKANPEVTVEVGTDSFDVRARVAEGEERERIWERQKQLMPGFAEYEQKTERQIPVVVLERV